MYYALFFLGTSKYQFMRLSGLVISVFRLHHQETKQETGDVEEKCS